MPRFLSLSLPFDRNTGAQEHSTSPLFSRNTGKRAANPCLRANHIRDPTLPITALFFFFFFFALTTPLEVSLEIKRDDQPPLLFVLMSSLEVALENILEE